MNDPIERAFKKLFGDMYLSESETALRIFEFGYKAGVEAEREACAKVCEEMARPLDDISTTIQWVASECANAIRERGTK